MSAYDFSSPVTQDLTLVPEYGQPTPTLTMAKTLMNNINDMQIVKSLLPIGSALPDDDPTVFGIQNPWLVAHYGTALDANGVECYAMAIIRQFLCGTAYGISGDEDYGSSSENTYLKTTYYNSLSTEAKSSISIVTMKLLNNSTQTLSIFLPSATNLCLETTTATLANQTNGDPWELFGGTATDSALESRKCARVNAQTAFTQYITRDTSPVGYPYRWYYAAVNIDGAYFAWSDDSLSSTYLRPAAYILGKPVSDNAHSGGTGTN
ncbi:MAG: DUF6273 domain-containing protein [Acetobacter sp.]|nr:DUF6273 domain-containing protein [Acetobacter sp.]